MYFSVSIGDHCFYYSTLAAVHQISDMIFKSYLFEHKVQLIYNKAPKRF